MKTGNRLAVRMTLVFFSILCAALTRDYQDNQTFMVTVAGTYSIVVLMCYVFAKNLMALTKLQTAALVVFGCVVIYDTSKGFIFPAVFTLVIALISLVVVLRTEQEESDK